jgi:peptide/nickel transport system permease protein
VRRSLPRALGAGIIVLAAIAAAFGPRLAPYAPDRRFSTHLNAPPTVVRLRDASGRWHAPFIYRHTRVSQLEQRYKEDRSQGVPLAWWRGGRMVASSDERAPLLLLGADSFGRDVFSRLLAGARVSLGLAVLAAAGALAAGGLAGGLAGYAGGVVDDVLMRSADFVILLPATYVALALRSVMPLVLSARDVFLLLTAIFAALGAPIVARGVRAIVRSERRREYAMAAESLGAGHARLLGRHLLPAAGPFAAVQLTLLIPSFIVAEATLSYVGLGFPDPVASWGTMLHEASNVRALADFPWLLSPAAAIFAVVAAVNLVLQHTDRQLVQDRSM